MNAPPAKGEDQAAREARIAALARDVEQKRESSTRATLGIELLKQDELLLDGERSTWEARAAAISTHDPVEGRAIFEKLVASFATLRTWQEYVRQQRDAATTRAQEQEAKLRTLSGDDAVHAQIILDTYRQRESDLRRALDQMLPLERLLRHFRDDFEGRREDSFTERVRDRAAATWLWIRRIWNYEVTTVDDSYETADGRKLTVSRSVTLGKTVGAVLIVVLGYLLSSFIARRVERFVVARRGVATPGRGTRAELDPVPAHRDPRGLRPPEREHSAHGVRLPGRRARDRRGLRPADASQELRRRAHAAARATDASGRSGRGRRHPRPRHVDRHPRLDDPGRRRHRDDDPEQRVRRGQAHELDVLESGGPQHDPGRGRVRNVAAEGGRRARGRRRDGTALVRKTPPPQVYLDEYGDSAIWFAVAYWVDMTPDNDTRRIRSDLLHMIERAFAEAGISMPLPQRDIRVASAGPLKVEVVPPAAPGSAAS